MAKRKNPLKNLDEFLKKEASSFVQQESESVETTASAQPQDIKSHLIDLAEQDPERYRTELYDLIKSSLDSLSHTTPEDKMLINTLLYITNKDSWRESVAAYWKNK